MSTGWGGKEIICSIKRQVYNPAPYSWESNQLIQLVNKKWSKFLSYMNIYIYIYIREREREREENWKDTIMEEIEKMQDKEVILKREFDKCLFPKQKQKQKKPFFCASWRNNRVLEEINFTLPWCRIVCICMYQIKNPYYWPPRSKVTEHSLCLVQLDQME